MSLSGKTLFITGASRGIGLAIGLRAARDGANVAIAAKTTDPHPKLPGTIYTAAEEIERAGGKALGVTADVADGAAVQKMVAAAAARFGGVDILVNNAAVRAEQAFENMTLEQWRAVTSIILDGAFNCVQACLPYLKKGGAGAIVNIGGLSAHTGAETSVYKPKRHLDLNPLKVGCNSYCNQNVTG